MSGAPLASVLSALLLGLATAGCGTGDPPAASEPGFALRAVVVPSRAAAEAAAPRASETAPEPADPEALEAVLGGLAGPDARLHRLALADARALGDAAVAPLAAILRDPAQVPARRAAAAHALAGLGTERALSSLLGALESEHEAWLRAQCAWRISTLQIDAAVPRLVLRLKYEADDMTVVWIAESLSTLGHLAGLDGLRVVRDTSGDEAARASAGERLAAIAAEHGFESGDELYAAWYAGDPTGRIRVPQPSPALLREAWDWIARLGEWDLRRVDDARFVLVRLEGWVVPLLAQSLHESDVYTRVHAAQVLERRGARARAAAPELVAALADARLGPQAALALGAIGDRAAAPPLEALLVGAPDLERRVAAARALGRAGTSTSIEPLRAASGAGQPLDLRQAAAAALVGLDQGDAQAGFLLECLLSPAADAGSAEHALGAWIAGRARDGAQPWAGLCARWRALDPAAGSVPDATEVAHRRAERAALAREALAHARR
ncbi:MAG: hypothetical protein JNK02_01315 [Planctomycetes bacterium]|nr:hypothetical protein [Planctomycetota bacterium]